MRWPEGLGALSKRFSSSEEKCWASPAEPPLPQVRILPSLSSALTIAWPACSMLGLALPWPAAWFRCWPGRVGGFGFACPLLVDLQGGRLARKSGRTMHLRFARAGRHRAAVAAQCFVQLSNALRIQFRSFAWPGAVMATTSKRQGCLAQRPCACRNNWAALISFCCLRTSTLSGRRPRRYAACSGLRRILLYRRRA